MKLYTTVELEELFFSETIPILISVGMTEEQIWYGEPRMFESYIVADELKKTYDNQLLWEQGVYFAKALSTILGSMFGGKNNDNPSYFEKPLKEFDYYIREINENEEKEAQENDYIGKYNYWAKFSKKAF